MPCQLMVGFFAYAKSLEIKGQSWKVIENLEFG
jgi:NADH pyrophosphatase NudC (nudix superfamily)